MFFGFRLVGRLARETFRLWGVGIRIACSSRGLMGLIVCFTFLGTAGPVGGRDMRGRRLRLGGGSWLSVSFGIAMVIGLDLLSFTGASGCVGWSRVTEGGGSPRSSCAVDAPGS